MIQLQIQIDDSWLSANLESGQSISMEETSQVWDTNAGRSSIPFTLSVWENQHILGNVSDMRGSSIFKRLYGCRFKLWVNGVIFRTGVIHLDSSVPVTDKVEIELVGNGKEWSDLISDIECRKVPLIGDVLLGKSYVSENGEAIINVKTKLSSNKVTITDYHSGRTVNTTLNDRNAVFQDIVFPNLMIPSDDNINVSVPYDNSHAYCNIRLCIQDVDSDGNKIHKMAILDADRVNASPCFYVLYFLDCLFKHLGVQCINNRLKAFDDFKRLAFINTACMYVNKASDPLEEVTSSKITSMPTNNGAFDSWAKVRSKRTKDILIDKDKFYFSIRNGIIDSDTKYMKKAYATSENFPNRSVTDVVDALQNMFGARILYDSESKSAKIVLVRDILTQKTSTEIPCRIINAYPIYDDIRGFRIRYSKDIEEEDVNTRDYERDTTYNYPHVINTRNDLTFEEVASNVSAYDKTFYIDKNTGNGYVIKVDKDATTENELFPSIQEAAAYVRVEYGDCSDNDFIDEVIIDATPAVMSFTNPENGESVNENNGKGVYAFFVDVSNIENKNTRTTKEYKTLQFDYKVDGEDCYVTSEAAFEFEVIQNYTPTYDISSDTESPFDNYDCGLTLGFMRGPGNQAGVEIDNPNYDGEGNSTWYTVASNESFNADSIDHFGNQFDYNGVNDGIGGDGHRISLKLKAEKKVNGEYLDANGTGAAGRGIFDQFYSEYAYWVTHRKIAHIEAEVELADILNLDVTKKYTIGDYVGFLKSCNYNISDNGLGIVTFELYYL